MATSRHSSLWDRWRSDSSSFSDAAWNAWLQQNYPGAVERTPNGGYVNEAEPPRQWTLTPERLAQTVWSLLRQTIPGATEAERYENVRLRFSFSEHELNQVRDIVAHISGAGQALNQTSRWIDLLCIMNEVEGRIRQDKATVYAMFGIRADAAQG